MVQVSFYRLYFIVLFFFGYLLNAAESPNSVPSGSIACEKMLAALERRENPIPLLARLIGEDLSMDNIRHHLSYLTGEKPIYIRHSLRDRYSETNKEWARHYIMGYLQRLGHLVKLEDFGNGLNFYIDIEGTVYPKDLFEVTAHYDTVRTGVPGADDNGSGTGMLLELARLFTTHRPERSLRIVFMDLEEQGFQGSRFHAKALKREFEGSDRAFLGTLVLDTIGYNPRSREKTRVVVEVGEASDFTSAYRSSSLLVPKAKATPSPAYDMTLQCAQSICFQFLRFADANSMRGPLELTVEKSTAKPGTADHGSYWDEKLPAVLIAAPYEGDYINPGYHKETDTIEQMNWDYYSRVGQFVVESVAHLTLAKPRFTDEGTLKKYLRGILKEENIALQSAPVLVDQLATAAAPSYTSSGGGWFDKDKLSKAAKWYEEHPPEKLALVLSSNLEQLSLINTNDQEVWITDIKVASTVLRQGLEREVILLRKVESGVVSFMDVERVSKWLRKGRSSELPKGFEVEKVSLSDLDGEEDS